MKILLSEIMLVRFILKTKCKLKMYFVFLKIKYIKIAWNISNYFSKSRMIIYKDEEKLEFLTKKERERLTMSSTDINFNVSTLIKFIWDQILCFK